MGQTEMPHAGLVCVLMALEQWHPLTMSRRVLVVSPMTGIEETLCLSVCCRKIGIILFTCLLRSWLWCLIHVRSLAGDSWMNDAI